MGLTDGIVTPASNLTLLNRDTVAGNENVWKISLLRIAYKGTSSVLYFTFRSIEDGKLTSPRFAKVYFDQAERS
jgi:hypothetical protein